jgi:histidine triad (HIT) family protein
VGSTISTYDDQNVLRKSFAEKSPAKTSMKPAYVGFSRHHSRSPGHTLVIPKAPVRGILDVAADVFAEVALTATKIAGAAVKAFDTEGIIVQQFSEAANGQVVFHLPMHVMPVRTDVDLLPPQTRKEDARVLQNHATRMISAMSVLAEYSVRRRDNVAEVPVSP